MLSFWRWFEGHNFQSAELILREVAEHWTIRRKDYRDFQRLGSIVKVQRLYLDVKLHNNCACLACSHKSECRCKGAECVSDISLVGRTSALRSVIAWTLDNDDCFEAAHDGYP